MMKKLKIKGVLGGVEFRNPSIDEQSKSQGVNERVTIKLIERDIGLGRAIEQYIRNVSSERDKDFVDDFFKGLGENPDAAYVSGIIKLINQEFPFFDEKRIRQIGNEYFRGNFECFYQWVFYGEAKLKVKRGAPESEYQEKVINYLLENSQSILESWQVNKEERLGCQKEIHMLLREKTSPKEPDVKELTAEEQDLIAEALKLAEVNKLTKATEVSELEALDLTAEERAFIAQDVRKTKAQAEKQLTAEERAFIVQDIKFVQLTEHFPYLHSTTIERVVEKHFRNNYVAAFDYIMAEKALIEEEMKYAVCGEFLKSDCKVKNPTMLDIVNYRKVLEEAEGPINLNEGVCVEFLNKYFEDYIDLRIKNDPNIFQNWLDDWEQFNSDETDFFGIGIFFGVTTRITIFWILEYLKCPKIHNLVIKVKIKQFFLDLKERFKKVT